MEKLTDISAVGFDAFGTLIDDTRRPDHKEVLKIFKKYSLDFKKANVLTTRYPDTVDGYYESIFNKLFDIQSEGKTYADSVSQDDKEILKRLMREELESYSLRDGSLELIEKIKQEVGIVFLISNLSSIYIKKVKELLPEGTFDFSIYSCNEGIKKNPDNTNIFDLAIQKIGSRIPPNQILFTGDNENNDIKAPKNAGMKSIHIDLLRKLILNNK